MAPLILTVAGFALAGLYYLARAIARRQGTVERRRLESLGRVDAHREVRRNGN